MTGFATHIKTATLFLGIATVSAGCSQVNTGPSKLGSRSTPEPMIIPEKYGLVHVVLPAVEGAAYVLSAEGAFGEWVALVGAGVARGVEGALYVVDNNFIITHPDGKHLPEGDLIDRGDADEVVTHRGAPAWRSWIRRSGGFGDRPHSRGPCRV